MKMNKRKKKNRIKIKNDNLYFSHRQDIIDKIDVDNKCTSQSLPSFPHQSISKPKNNDKLNHVNNTNNEIVIQQKKNH